MLKRADGRNPNQLRPLACSRGVLNRAHGSARWCQGDTIVLAAVYGPKAGTKKGENPEKASIEVIWRPKTGQSGNQEKEYEMILKRTIQSICLLNAHPNTTTSIIVQVVEDDGSLLSCAINASCVALADAGIQLKCLAVAISCGVAVKGSVVLDPSNAEIQDLKAFVHLALPSKNHSVIPKGSPMDEDGTITSCTSGRMSEGEYFDCVRRGTAASAAISDFLRRNLEKQDIKVLQKQGIQDKQT